jgi:hypothetical protein
LKNERRSKESEFAEVLYEADSGSRSSDRQAQRKTQQLCRQVERALNLAFAGLSGGLGGLFVDRVSPAPDCGRLLVHVVIPADRPAADAMDALRRETPRLRSEVAAAITRKRARELSFVPTSQEGCDHE